MADCPEFNPQLYQPKRCRNCFQKLEDHKLQAEGVQNNQPLVSSIPNNPEPKERDDSDDTENVLSDGEDDGPISSSIFQQRTIFIRDLPTNMPDQRLFDTLSAEFSTVGRIKISHRTKKPCIHLFRKRYVKTRLTGKATITYEQEASAMNAIKNFNGKCVQTLNNAQITVEMAENRGGLVGKKPENVTRNNACSTAKEQLQNKKTLSESLKGLKLAEEEDKQPNQDFSSLRASSPETTPIHSVNLGEPEDNDDNESINSAADPKTLEDNTIFIWSLPWNMAQEHLFNSLYDIFSTIGQIKIDRRTTKPCIYLFKHRLDRSKLSGNAKIIFEEENSVTKAIEKYNGQPVELLNNFRIGVKKSEISEGPSKPPLRPVLSEAPQRQSPTTVSSTAPQRQSLPEVLSTEPLKSRSSVNQPKGKVSVYWDIENVAVSREQSAFKIAMKLRQRLITSRGLMENSFTAYCDTNVLPRQHQIGLDHANVGIRHLTGLKTGNADRQIYMDLQIFKEHHQAPATIILISGDIDFIKYINELRFRHGHYIIVVHNKQARQELLDTANEAYPWEEFLEKLEDNFVETQNPRTEPKVSNAVPHNQGCNFRQFKNENNEKEKFTAVPRTLERNPTNFKNPRNGPGEFDAPGHILLKNNATTVAGGNRQGNAVNQLNNPEGLFVDDDQTMIIADTGNARIIQWKIGDTNGKVVAGGSGEGNRLDQLNHPTDVVVDKRTNSLIICDYGNQRVVQWSRFKDTTKGEILIDNIHCSSLAMDQQRYLYVSDVRNSEVKRYRLGDENGTVVAGGHGKGTGLNQLNWPTYLFVDQQQNVCVRQ